MASAQAVTAADFALSAARLGLSRALPVVVAVSGGADSMALMHLASTYFHQPTAVTVDHTLRPESTQEAATVETWLKQMGVRHQTLQIDWSTHQPHAHAEEGIGDNKPKTSIMEKARHVRYQLLRDFCRKNGCKHLLTGHHRDDQVETFMFRLMRGSGLDGLRGMRPITTLQEIDPGLQLVRPLLSFEKNRLYATCRENGIPWVEDPTNKKTVYQRNSIRQGLDLLYGTTNIQASDLSDLTDTIADVSASFDHQVSYFLQHHTHRDNKYAVITLQQSPMCNLPTPISNRVIVRATQWANGSAYPPSYDSIGRLQKVLKSDWSGAGTGVAIGGAVWFKLNSASQKGPVVAVCRQPPTRQELTRFSLPIRMGEEVWWDGRYGLRLAPSEKGQRDTSIDAYTVRHLTDRDYALLAQKQAQKGLRRGKRAFLDSITGAPGSTQRVPLPLKCRTSLPALTCSQSGRILSVPHIGYLDEESPVVLKGKLRPRHPL
eukprot:comp5002_c0_seq1/m.1095 comp5002_c0_seq1/g.1095  ORF comp5002_c0_seq1/g.1095 comp5002_c0_seq1/m.1095 type:complete len:489 (-) comp5002_c0_seq1:309-1775(-)